MLAFWIDRVDQGFKEPISRALFELGCRIGAPFTILDGIPGDLPSDAILIRYGPAADQGLPPSVVQLPFAKPDAPCAVIAGEPRLWGLEGIGGLDVVVGAAELLSGRAEAKVPDAVRSPFGSFDPIHHPLARSGVLCEPLVENAARHLESLLLARGVGLNGRSHPWGCANGYAMVLTHDVDGPQLQRPFALFRSAAYALLKRDAKEFEALQLGIVSRLLGAKDPYWNFEDWLRLEALHGIRSTFYLYVDRPAGVRRHFNDPRYDIRRAPFPDTLRRVRDAGCELGLHYGIKAHSVDAYAKARVVLDQVVGQSGVTGGRAHYWSIDWREPFRSWRALEAAGLKHDSSLSPMALGFRFGSALPILPAFGRSASPWEGIVTAPTPIMDAYVAEPAAALNMQDRLDRVTALLASIRRVGGLGVLDWHVRTLANRGPWRNYIYPLLHCLDLVAADSDAKWMTMGEAAAAWSAHVRRCYRPTRDVPN